MKEFLAVLSYTFKENSRKKAFIISTVITLVLTVLIVSMPAIINSFNSNKKANTDQSSVTKTNNEKSHNAIYVVNSKDILKDDLLLTLSNSFKDYDFKATTTENISNLKEKVNKEDNTALLVIDEKAGVPTFDYFVKKYGSGLEPDLLSKAIKSVFVKNLLVTAKVSDNVSNLALQEVSYNTKELGKGAMKSYISSMMISMALFFAIYFYGYGVSMSVASEKTSRVMELLVTSTKPSKIVLGKSFAMGLLGLIQLLMVMLTALVTYKIDFPKDFTIAGQALDFSNFTPVTILLLIVYFILGYSVYAMMNAVAGATVSKAEDVNSAIMPISMISLIAFYFGFYSAIGAPGGNISIAASIIPFSAPFSMPCRLLSTEVPLWQISASLFSLVVTIAFIAWISIKLYSAAVLHYGKRLKLNDLLKMTNK